VFSLKVKVQAVGRSVRGQWTDKYI